MEKEKERSRDELFSGAGKCWSELFHLKGKISQKFINRNQSWKYIACHNFALCLILIVLFMYMSSSSSSSSTCCNEPQECIKAIPAEISSVLCLRDGRKTTNYKLYGAKKYLHKGCCCVIVWLMVGMYVIPSGLLLVFYVLIRISEYVTHFKPFSHQIHCG